MRHQVTYQITCQDVLEWCEGYKGEKFHAVLCDPPYNLDTIKKRFGKSGSAPAKYGKDGVFQRASKGFMGKEWDDDVAFYSETWERISEHLYPGAFIMAFGGSRTWHRLAVAMEDAGLVIHPTIFCWVQSQGFPKSTRINRNDNGHDEWAGHRYGLQALKPSCEALIIASKPCNTYDVENASTPLAETEECPGSEVSTLDLIIVAQKPYEGKPVECITETGAGAMNIEASRIQGPKGDGVWGTNQVNCQGAFNASPNNAEYRTRQHPAGRWPANFALVHSPDCDEECVPECPVRRLGEQSGEKPSRWGRPAGGNAIFGSAIETTQDSCKTDTGTAARFFFNADWQYEVAEQIATADPVRYNPKAGRKERDAGLEGNSKEVVVFSNGKAGRCPIHDTTNRSSQNCYACGCPIQYRKERKTVGKLRNHHPTVKPIALCQWLATLLLPPPEYTPRRILIPFSGSGSEMIGAMQAGWEEIIGVELTEEYVEIAEARLKYWENESIETNCEENMVQKDQLKLPIGEVSSD